LFVSQQLHSDVKLWSQYASSTTPTAEAIMTKSNGTTTVNSIKVGHRVPTHNKQTEILEDDDTDVISIPLIDYHTLLQSEHTMICILANSGFGSNMIQVLAQKIYYSDRGVNFVADDNQYGYKWNDTTGVLNGFFQPRFPVFRHGAYNSIHRDYGLPPMGQIMELRAFRAAKSQNNKITVQWAINEEFRTNFRRQYENGGGFKLYNRFVTEACNHLQFHPRANRVIQNYIQQYAPNIPSGVHALRRTHSVAFHVRRGDKVYLGESRQFSAQEYVNKLLQLFQNNDNNIVKKNVTTITDCFVASDDYRAVDEIKKALQDAGIGCQVHYLASRVEQQKGIEKASYRERESTVQFLAELSLLLDATYFIGTFNSNVGSLASVLRKCHYFGTPHYAHSYGVDRDEWYYIS